MTKKPSYRFAGYTESWVDKKLGEYAKYRRGSFPQPYGKKEWYGGEDSMPFVQVIDVTDNLTLVNDTKQKISKQAQPKSVLAPEGTVIVTLQGSIGRVAITHYDAYVDRTLLIFESYNFPTHVGFWAYTIQNKFEIERKKAPGGTIKTITKEALSSFEISLPSLPEQTAIGSFFQDIDQLISLQQHKLEVLKEQKKTYLKLLFPVKGQTKPALRFAGFEEEWKEVKVSDIFRVTRGQVLATTEISEEKTDTHKYPVYSSQTKNEGLLGYYDKYLFETAITWTTDGANAGTVNYREGKFYSTNVNGVLLSDEGFANKVIAEILNNEAWKYVSKVGNPKLMNNVMSEISLVIPNDFREISILSTFFQDLDKAIAKQEEKVNQLKESKQTLLRKMFI